MFVWTELYEHVDEDDSEMFPPQGNFRSRAIKSSGSTLPGTKYLKLQYLPTLPLGKSPWTYLTFMQLSFNNKVRYRIHLVFGPFET